MSLRATRAIDVDRISDMKKALYADIARHQARAIQNQSRQPRRLNSGRPKSILESALIEFANPAIIRALVQGYAAEHRPYDGGLAHALRNAALGRRLDRERI